jgi:hypothetical protein
MRTTLATPRGVLEDFGSGIALALVQLLLPPTPLFKGGHISNTEKV